MCKGRDYSVFTGHFVRLCGQGAVKPIPAFEGETEFTENPLFGVLFTYHFLPTIQVGALLH